MGSEQLSVELRVVNHKFIEVKARLPREMAALEIELVARVKDRLARGAVEVQVHRRALHGAATVFVDLPLAQEYARAYGELQASLGLHDALTTRQLFQVEGVVRLEEQAPGLEPARLALHGALDSALLQVLAMREREGEALGVDLRSRLGTLRALANAVAIEAPAALAAYRHRLLARTTELLRTPPDSGRLEQEVALLAERIDVAEELTRLDSHLAQFAELLDSHGPSGRRLDFLAQELHREITTLGNKSQNVAIARNVIELKAEAERIREQVQNIE